MMKPPERVEIPEQEDLRRERFARILAVLIVIATLGVASVEYLHSIAEQRADSAGVEAQRLSIERQGEIVRADDAARANIDVYAHEQQQRTESGNAFQEFLSPAVAQGSSQAKLLQLEQERWSMLASLTGDLTDVKPSTAVSPQTDTNFPNVLLNQSERNANRLLALGDGKDQLRSDWLGRAGLLSVILTLLAVAIYLFGLSLTLQARIRRWLVGLGVVLVVVGALSTAVLQFSNPTEPSDAAADSYADGVYAMNTFYTRPGTEGLQEAYNDFSKAIQARPRFARAYLLRAEVQFLLGSPERNSSIVSITTPSSLQASSKDLQQAYDLGLRDKDLLNNLASVLLLLAVTKNDNSQLNPAISYIDQALKLDPNDPLLYYNKGYAYLAQNNMSQAQQEYGLAVQHTLYTDVSHKTLRNDPAIEEQEVAGALTPLDLLAHDHPNLASQVTSIKELIVNGVDRNQAAPGQAAKAKITQLSVFPGELQWSAQIDGIDITKANVSTEWWFQSPQKLGWSVISAMSGPSAVATQTTVQTNDNTVYQDTCSGCSADDYFLINSSLKTMNECLQQGTYRVELYINGHLAASGSSDQSYPGMQAEAMQDLAVDFCHPTSWKQTTSSSSLDVQPGFSNLFTSSDGTSGAYFVRFQNPGVTPSDTDASSQAQAFRDEVLKFFSSSVLPSDAGTPVIDCGTTSNGTASLPWGPNVDSSCNRTDAFFLGLKGANEAWYTYNGGILHIGSGFASDGAVLVAFSFGPNSQWTPSPEPLPDDVFDSFVFTQQ